MLEELIICVGGGYSSTKQKQIASRLLPIGRLFVTSVAKGKNFRYHACHHFKVLGNSFDPLKYITHSPKKYSNHNGPYLEYNTTNRGICLMNEVFC